MPLFVTIVTVCMKFLVDDWLVVGTVEVDDDGLTASVVVAAGGTRLGGRVCVYLWSRKNQAMNMTIIATTTDIQIFLVDMAL